jgi:hypothetical protein
MPKTTCLVWKVHTPSLLKEIATSSGNSILRIPLQTLGDILYEVADRAKELDDPKMNALMCRLTLYSQADPEDKKNYNKSLVRKTLAAQGWQ